MAIKRLLDKLNSQPIIILSDEEYHQFLNESEILDEKDTFFSDKIRIISSKSNLFIQEKSNKGEIIVRQIESLEEGYKFLKDRLAVYENMWNGCGCKIDYYT